ncbi:hypothetical protein [Thermus hydrothermalis]|uniref:hypothetical protein n=1 Tax=Thermus hydrothermalis TaxID=2908148 RepID=UPI001FAAF18A|nr:hypothetical protein [Thermus hydrothermalis]
MAPEAVIRYARSNPGRVVALRVLDFRGAQHHLALKWEGGGVRFFVRPWGEWTEPQSEPRALEVMRGWRIQEVRLEGEDGAR